ncbi:MAG: hypothetical protein ACREUT_14955 [Steroidobacteraceae bacterium]
MPWGSEDRAAALASAASRLAHAMRESCGPVDRMAAALERMMRALARHEHCRTELEREIAICIESLQFHDSLMQQLAQVRAGLAAAGGAGHPPSETRLADGAAGSIELF